MCLIIFFITFLICSFFKVGYNEDDDIEINPYR